MITYHIKKEINLPISENIYESSNGRGYFKYNQLHLISINDHYVYKFETDAWYRRNELTMTDHYLGKYAEPSIILPDIDIKDEEYWNSIIILDEGNQKEEN